MIEVRKLSRHFDVRRLTEADTDEVLGLYLENPQYFSYTETDATHEQVLSDMRDAPPGVDAAHKHFVGLFGGSELVAVMDVVEGYPDTDIAYLGLLMVRRRLQGTGLGGAIVHEAEACLRASGHHRVRLAISADNPQATHFWEKNGYMVTRVLSRGGHQVLEAEHAL